MEVLEHSLVLLLENPVLGPGRISFVARRKLPNVVLIFTGGVHPCRRGTRIAPYPLPDGSSVRFRAGLGDAWRSARVLRELPTRPESRRSFMLLVGGDELEADEAHLEPISPDRSEILERLSSRRWDQPVDFFARRGLLRDLKVSYEDTGGLPTLTGGRIRYMPHQVYAVQRVLWARTPRFVLADEVGLGKTIEAGMIIQALMASNPDLSVLVVAPGSMTRQWLCELYLRFGARAFQVADDLSRPLRDLVIVSTTTLSRQRDAWEQLTRRNWGMIVIDEAHHHPPGSPLYSLYRDLSRCCEGILVLSATPSKRELRGLLGLLALVAPDQYSTDDEERVRKLWELRQQIWDRLGYQQMLREAPDFLEMPASELEAIADEWSPLLGSDPAAEPLIERLRRGDRTAFDELEAYVQEHYRVDHRIIRTRRRTVQSLGQPWCERILEVVEYSPSAEEALLTEHFESRLQTVAILDSARRALCATYLRLLRATPGQCLAALRERLQCVLNGAANSDSERWWEDVLSDPSPEDETKLDSAIFRTVESFPQEDRWLSHAIELAAAWRRRTELGGRHIRAIDWIVSHIAANPDEKLLVFTEYREVARAFAEALSKRIGKVVEAFHWGDSAQDEERLKRITLDFQRSPDRPVLVSDELGGEGRNFQMAAAVLHLDCPWSVARLEQRIGRLDRIGRDADRPVRSVVFLGVGGVEHEIHRIHAEIFRVHQRSIGGLEFLLPSLQRRIFEAAVTGVSTIQSGHAALALEVEQALRDAEQDFDQSLDTSKHELERSRELVDIMEQGDGVERQRPLQYWSRALGLSARQVDRRGQEPEYHFEWSPDELNASLPGFPSGAGVRRDIGTFNRHIALAREDLQFFAPGHRLIDAHVRALQCSHIGRLTVCGRDLGSKHRGRAFALIVVHFDLEPALWTELPFDTGLLTRARRRLFPEVIEQSVRLHPGSTEPAALVEDYELRAAIEAEFTGRDSARPVPPDAMDGKDLYDLDCALELAIELAVAHAKSQRDEYANEARSELEQDLAAEMGFLQGQVRRENHREAEAALRQRRLLLDNLTTSRTSVAGVALIVGM